MDGLIDSENNFKFFLSFFRGSAIAKIVGANAARLPNFDDRVTMYVFEELIDGKKLTEIINETHENVKYLPGHKLPANVVSEMKINDKSFLEFRIRKQFEFSVEKGNVLK